jgi:T-complex protein 1 subunit gamma
MRNNISVLRRVRKTDNNRIARCCTRCWPLPQQWQQSRHGPPVVRRRAVGATIVNRTDEIKESDIGTGAGLFEIRKVGDE